MQKRVLRIYKALSFLRAVQARLSAGQFESRLASSSGSPRRSNAFVETTIPFSVAASNMASISAEVYRSVRFSMIYINIRTVKQFDQRQIVSDLCM